MKRLMYTRIDGGVSIVYPVNKESLSLDEYENYLNKLELPDGAHDATIIEDDVIPKDRQFRDAWRQVDGKIDFDLVRAKDIQLECIRKAREPKLLELDKHYMLALEQGRDTKDIVAAKQELRDITEPLKALEPASIEDIKAAFPDELK